MPLQIEIDYRTGRQGIESRAQVRHSSCQNGRNQQSGDSMRHLGDDEGWINPVSFAKICRRYVIKSEQHDPDHEEECELKKNCSSAGKKREDGLPLVSCSQ